MGEASEYRVQSCRMRTPKKEASSECVVRKAGGVATRQKVKGSCELAANPVTSVKRKKTDPTLDGSASAKKVMPGKQQQVSLQAGVKKESETNEEDGDKGGFGVQDAKLQNEDRKEEVSGVVAARPKV